MAAPVKSSIQIYNEIGDLDNRIAETSDAFNKAEGDAKDALRDQINMLKGEKKSLNEQLGDALDYEDGIRKGGGIPLADPSSATNAAKPGKTLAEMLLGPRDEFKALDFGHKLRLDVLDASDLPYTDFKLPGREEIDYNLPRQTTDQGFQFGFLNSLPKGTTKADILKYFVKDETAYKNAAAAWQPGNEKPSSKMGWKQESAQMETLAHLMPVLEQQVKDWGQLRSLIDIELLMGLRLVEAQASLKGNNSDGITGVLNNTGIQKYTAATGDDLVDSSSSPASCPPTSRCTPTSPSPLS